MTLTTDKLSQVNSMVSQSHTPGENLKKGPVPMKPSIYPFLRSLFGAPVAEEMHYEPSYTSSIRMKFPPTPSVLYNATGNLHLMLGEVQPTHSVT